MKPEISPNRLRVFLHRKSKMQPRKTKSDNLDVKGKNQIGWTETARLQVIEAVIRVEEEIFMEEKNGARPSTSTGRLQKWDRIANQLPPEFRGHVQDSTVDSYKRKGHKCQRLFGNLLYAYRGIGRKRLMTPPVYEMMKKCEELRQSRFSRGEESLNSGGLNSSRTTSLPSNDLPQVSPTNSSSLNSLGNQEYSSKSPSIGTEKEQAGPLLRQDRIHREKSASAFKVRVDIGKRGRGAQSPSQTGGRKRISNLHPTRQSNRASRSEKKITTLGTDTILHMTLDRPRRRLAQELSALSSWVNSELISEGRKAMQEMTSSAIRSTQRRKVHLRARGITTEPFDYLTHRSLSSMIDSRIQNYFQKLRMRFAVELKNTCVELATGVLLAMEVS